MAKKLTIQQNDNGIKLLFTIFKDKQVSDIANAKIRIKFVNPSEEKEFWKEAKIVDAENGQAQCVLFKKDIEGIGTYQTEVETTYPNGVRLSDKNPFLITIVPEIFDLTQEVVEDFPDYKDENLE